MVRHYQAIVVGCGGVGSAALYHLARRGQKALGIDRFGIAHARGSSHGQSRVIRMAYYEHPDYVPLLQRAYQLWDELDRQVPVSLFLRVGVLQVGPPDGEVVPGVLESARCYGLPVECWTPAQLARRTSAFHVPHDLQIVFEQNAGYLMVEACVQAHLQAAQAEGADWLAPAVVQKIVSHEREIHVVTDHETFSCDRLVVSGGPWAASILDSLQLPLQVLRKPLHWFAAPGTQFHPATCPVYMFEVEGKFFYGFPQHDERGIKVAQHLGGEVVVDPTNVDREVDGQERQEVIEFTQKYLQGVMANPTDHAVCMYTMTPDKHFIIDQHPADPRIAFACGLSGHGFKFTSVLGEILADLTLEGRTELPVEFLKRQRSS